METELSNLETRLALLFDAFQKALQENRELRMRVISLEHDKKNLNAKVQTAVERVEAMLSKLPEGTDQ